MEKEHIEEIKREEAQEIREEPMYIWIEENKSILIGEYIDMYEDEFMEFAKGRYKEEN
jgi:hypothetical protein